MDAEAAVAGAKTIQGAFQVLAALGLTAQLWPKQAKVKDQEKFDFIVIGAGTAGSVVASRLSENKNCSVLLIEAGGDPPVESVLPGLFSFLKRTKGDWNYTSVDDGYTERFHKGNVADLTRGKMLGGSSSVNFMAYTRGNYHDYDNWAKLINDSSWTWDNVLPYFIKSEKLLDEIVLESEDFKYHGTKGPMEVTKPHHDSVNKYLEAFQELGNRIVLDTNTGIALGYTETMFMLANGKRYSTAYSFLSKLKHRPNLFVLKNALVTKIIFDSNKNAVGVKAIIDNKIFTFKADKEVILSAGAINSPQLLMLSGIGPKSHLKSKDIEVIADLPVGQTLQDHIMVMVVHKTGFIKTKIPVTLNPEVFPLPLILGFVTLNQSQNYPDYQTFSFIVDDPETLLPFCAFYWTFKNELCDQIYDAVKDRELFLSVVNLIYPESRGKILLRSSNPRDAPLIYTGYYSKDADLNDHAKFLEDFMEISNTRLFRSVGAEMIVPEFCGCDYLRDGRNFYRCYALCMMISGYHFAGSCPMGSVLDSRLRVHGVKKLRVADASVMPKITGANTCAPTVMIGEKAAEMIKEDNNLNKM